MEGFHPNLIPVNCENEFDILKLAWEMKKVCLPDVHVGEYVASVTEEEAIEKAKAMRDDIVSSGHLRFISYKDGRLANVCLTLLESNENKKQWNLSISHATAEGPQRVSDDLALLIAKVFLGDFEEVEPKAYWTNIRHFIKEECND